MKARWVVILVVVMALGTGSSAYVWPVEFILSGNDHLDVTSAYDKGTLWDSSIASVHSGGFIGRLYLNNTSAVQVLTDGYIGDVDVMDSSALSVFDGGAYKLKVWNTGSATVSGGSIDILYAGDSSTVSISGGSISIQLAAVDTSSITLCGYNFQATDGLSLDGQNVVGIGTLTGKWFDGTSWTIRITHNDPTASIWVVPEPSSLLALASGLGGARRGRA